MFKAKAGNGAGPGSGFSFIAPDVVIRGDIEAPGDLHVDGRIEGDVRCRSLIMGASGTIAGNVVADQARVGGTIEGALTVKELTILATAHATGDVAYDSISIEPGGRIEGRFAHRGAEVSGNTVKLIPTAA